MSCTQRKLGENTDTVDTELSSILNNHWVQNARKYYTAPHLSSRQKNSEVSTSWGLDVCADIDVTDISRMLSSFVFGASDTALESAGAAASLTATPHTHGH